jgi:HAD superfamily hydrolase (TIGR01450 family)
MLDLDGVVYIGPRAVPDAPARLGDVRKAGMRLAFVTNNASRPPRVVAEHLAELGVPAAPEDVVTSAQAAARLMAQRLPAGAPVFVIGGEGLFEALAELGLRGVQSVEEEPQGVVSGYGPDLRWRTVIDGAILVRRGLPWVVSNTDLTVPTPHGPGPGNGVLVKAVADYAERTPEVAGKPRPPLLQETLRRVGGSRPLVVGDRLDTDIEGAVAVGYDSLLVMTGVTGLAELVTATKGTRPTYVSATLAGLLEGQGPAEPGSGAGKDDWLLDGWRGSVREGRLTVTGQGSVDDWWRLVATTAWAWLDEHGEAVDVTGLAVPDG